MPPSMRWGGEDPHPMMDGWLTAKLRVHSSGPVSKFLAPAAVRTASSSPSPNHGESKASVDFFSLPLLLLGHAGGPPVPPSQRLLSVFSASSQRLLSALIGTFLTPSRALSQRSISRSRLQPRNHHHILSRHTTRPTVRKLPPLSHFGYLLPDPRAPPVPSPSVRHSHLPVHAFTQTTMSSSSSSS